MTFKTSVASTSPISRLATNVQKMKLSSPPQPQKQQEQQQQQQDQHVGTQHGPRRIGTVLPSKYC
ncbi:hypothetical protein TSAR_005898 [Trichomalopsis sarcophagae]|uniref:Uncharacterized protein n=1 Tax=Trichomalopsis sarcophagae TaxID=543379 RepID=A0A232FKW5_9HYME|nr:hypothetical protein TSAR_005898 [Trichomalopsis sarcophagae]